MWISVCVLWGWAFPAYAADDPHIAWEELESTHFVIHYPVTRAPLARRALAIAEETYRRLQPFLHWKPEEKTHIRVTDNFDEANGWARVIPCNEIQIYAYPPEPDSELWGYEDWLRQLIVHELTHILHNDTSNSSLHKVLNAIFGKFARSNATAPRWYTEGLAIYFETRLSNTGRLRNAVYRVMMRQAALERRIPSLGELSSGVIRWPAGTAEYLFGAFFIQYIAQTYGEESLSVWNHRYGDTWIPYALNRTAKNVWGKTFDELYDDWKNVETARSLADTVALRVHSMTRSTLLTSPFRHAQPQTVPRKNAISYVHNDGMRKKQIVVLPLNGMAPDDHSLTSRKPQGERQAIVECWGTCEHHWTPDGKTLYFAHLQYEDGYRTRTRLFRHDIESRRTTPVESVRRLRTFALDGDDLYWVEQNGDISEVYRFDTHGEPELLIRSAPFEQFDDIAVHEGIMVAAVFDPDRHRTDLRQIGRCADLLPDGVSSISEGSASWCQKQLTDSRATESGVSFGPDGLIYYASDASGELNLWRLSDDGSAVRMTHLDHGMQFPVIADNGDVFYMRYTSSGTAIARIAREHLIPLDDTLRRAPADSQKEEVDFSGLDARLAIPSEPARSYRPWRWLWPKTWRPVQTFADDALTLGISFGADEFSSHHAYTFKLEYNTKLDAVDYEIQYDWTGALWNLSLSSGLVQHRARYSPVIDVTRVFDYQTFYGSVGTSRVWNGRLWTQSLNLTYLVEYSESRDSISWPKRDPLDYPSLPSLGWTNAIVLGWAWSCMHSYERAMPDTEGYRVRANLRFEAPWLGAHAYSFIASASFRGAWALPSELPQTLRIDVSAGTTQSQDAARQPFSLSTQSGVSIAEGDTMMHAYAAGSLYGKHYLYSRLTWSAILLEPEIALSTLPVGISRLGIELFAEWASPWSDAFSWLDSKAAIGTRILIDYALGYRENFRFSIAYAWGMSRGGGQAVLFSYDF